MRYAVSAILFTAGAAQAALVALDLPAGGNYPSATVILTSQSYKGATFDIAYTISSVATGENAFVSSSGSQIGVGSATDPENHYGTLEGNDGEGLSFTGLSIVNFNANGSGLVIDDITDLKFARLTVNNVMNQQDGIEISFTDIETEPEQYNLNHITDSIHTIDLTGLANYGDSATDLYIKPDNISGANRWAVTGIEVEYTVPESVTLGII
jgi:hypothetical protein